MAKKKTFHRKQLKENRKLHAERSRQNPEAPESFSLLAAGVAHEFNNLLGAAHGHAEWALGSKDPKDMVSALEAVVLVCQRSAQLTKALQGFSQPREEKWLEANVREILEEALSLLKPSFDAHSIQVELKLEEASLLCLPEQLLEVFVNLLKNAMEASEGAHAVSKISVSMKNTQKGLTLCFQDNGPGVEEVYRENIFKPFWTTKGVLKRVHKPEDTGTAKDGSGLGLFWVRKILTEHGATISIEPSKEGALFCIFFEKDKSH